MRRLRRFHLQYCHDQVHDISSQGMSWPRKERLWKERITNKQLLDIKLVTGLSNYMEKKRLWNKKKKDPNS